MSIDQNVTSAVVKMWYRDPVIFLCMILYVGLGYIQYQTWNEMIEIKIQLVKQTEIMHRQEDRENSKMDASFSREIVLSGELK